MINQFNFHAVESINYYRLIKILFHLSRDIDG